MTVTNAGSGMPRGSGVGARVVAGVSTEDVKDVFVSIIVTLPDGGARPIDGDRVCSFCGTERVQ
jgi:hypothetical protein